MRRYLNNDEFLSTSISSAEVLIECDFKNFGPDNLLKVGKVHFSRLFFRISQQMQHAAPVQMKLGCLQTNGQCLR